MCPRAFCALCIVISTLKLGAFAAEECRNTGSTLKEAITDDDLPLSLVQMQAIRTRNTKAHLQNETENSTLEAAVVLLPSHSKKGVPKKFDNALGRYMTVSSANNFQAIMCTFGLACFAFIFVLNAILLCVQTQHQGSKKSHSPSKMQKSVDHLTVTSKLGLAAPEMIKQKLQTYTRAQRGISSGCSNGGASNCKGSTQLLQTSSERRPHDQKDDNSDLKQVLPFKILDPRLVLPLRETWYAVQIEEVFEADGAFEILRITGFPQLRANIVRKGYDQGGVLELFCSGGSPSAKKQLVARASSKSISEEESTVREKREVCNLLPPLLLVDKKERSLGELRPLARDRFELVYQDKTELTLTLNDARQLQLTSSCGSSLACTSIIAGHLGVCVNAGADTGLVICVTLAAVLLGGGKAALWNSSEAYGATLSEERQEEQTQDIIALEPSTKNLNSNVDAQACSDDK
mmetsp:Transcript_23106/g.36924  ORF Transcript_23106/g.36924 Transcript_23106/m.36924 type:complete len:462 (-) Transcript_23106:70-1455(-)|eukprot:CAMPEP_0169092738 /NCGR_PEP_ID=MMETSP1015-20121227/17065_1 /TAXON_ID=342587 /ORGANISM="Karlodinium micrum, Strain CCMP2283" /LENGTH=461 /DNA_ID=CAMNT_0009153335 /DNA_START=107 /DNA_END=1492 /DNA_ORIENTATION=+